MVFLSIGSSSSTFLDAQTPKPLPVSDVEQFTDAKSVSRQAHSAVPQTISLNISDSTLAYILETLGRQVDRPVIFDGKDSRFSRRKSVKISDTSVIGAFESVLEGTGLKVAVASDGRTVVIQSRPTVPPGSNPGGQQEKSAVSGVVIDSGTGKGIVGVTVNVVGTGASAVTDDNGAFKISNVGVGAQSLSFKLLGYVSTTRAVTVVEERAVSVRVALMPAATSLNEVVTTATGRQRKLEVGNDIVKINAAEILDKAPARSVSDLLRYAQVPGVQVTTASGEPGAPTRVTMRGIRSISQNTDPAIIVDGVWVLSSDTILNLAGGGGYGSGTRFTPSPLDRIDPLSIESIEVIRGPSAASLYGQEAANGVIVITTKRGQAGRTSWSYNFSRDWDSQVRQKSGQWISFGTDPLTPADSDRTCDITSHYNYFSGCLQDSAINLNRFGSLLDNTGPAENYIHNISVRGGVGSITYSLSVSRTSHIGTDRVIPAEVIRLHKLNIPYDKDIVKPTGKNSTFFNTSFGFSPNRNLNLTLTLNGVDDKVRQNGVEMLSLTAGVLGYADTLNMVGRAGNVDLYTGGSSVASLQAAINAQYNPQSWWSGQSQLGMDKSIRKDYRDKSSRYCDRGVCSPSADTRTRAPVTNDVFSGRLSLNGMVSTKFDRLLSLTPSIGFDFKRNISNTLHLSQTSNISTGETRIDQGTMNETDITTAGYYLNVNAKLLNRLFFDLGFRQDAGSVIKTSSSGSRYPKLASSWLVSDEGFFPQNSFLDLFRLRGAIGYAAVHPDAADLYGSYRYASTVINGNRVQIANLVSIGNNKLFPERSLEIEGGFDAYLWNDKLEVVFTLAHTALKNAIVTRFLPQSSGLSSSSRKENIARVDNRSVETSISYRAIDNDAWYLQIGMGITNTGNVIKKLGDNVAIQSNTSLNRLQEGYPIAGVWARPILGYGDIDNNGYIAPDEILLGDTTVFMGWSNPRMTSSYNVSMAFLRKAVNVSAQLSHRGSHVQRATYQDTYGLVAIGAPVDVQALARANTLTGHTNMDASEIRLTSVSISYALPALFIRRLNLNSANISVQGSNLGLWTKYSGRDPLVNSTMVMNEAASDNGFSVPMPRRYALNLRIGF